ncbi:hypothetical protein RCL1_006414 [Eukaryota sp. TZLM3-RCL]
MYSNGDTGQYVSSADRLNSLIRSVSYWDRPLISFFVFLLATILYLSFRCQIWWLFGAVFSLFSLAIFLQTRQQRHERLHDRHHEPSSHLPTFLIEFFVPHVATMVTFTARVFSFRDKSFSFVAIFFFSIFFLIQKIVYFSTLFYLCFITIMCLPKSFSVYGSFFIIDFFWIIIRIVIIYHWKIKGLFKVYDKLYNKLGEKGNAPLEAFRRGRELFDNGRTEDALLAYEEAIRIDPTFSSAHVNRGVALHKLERLADALEAYEEAIRVDYENSSAHCNMGNVLSKFNRLDEALESYDVAIKLDPIDKHYHKARGGILMRMNRLQEALQSFEKATSLDRFYADAFVGKGDVLIKMEQYEQALEAYQTAIRLAPTDASTYDRKGDVLRKLNRFNEALQAYDKAISLDPSNSGAYNGKGIVLQGLQRYQEAMDAYTLAISHDPTSTAAVNNRNNLDEYLQRISGSNHSLSTPVNQRAQSNIANSGFSPSSSHSNHQTFTYTHSPLSNGSQSPLVSCSGIRSAETFNSQGDRLYNLGRYEEALWSYNQAINLDPRFAPAHFGKGNCLSELMRFNEAIESFETATRIDPRLATPKQRRY